MQFEKIEAKDGNATLKVNNILLYSKYRPIIDAEKFIECEFNNDDKGYLLIGLGLGYHLHALLKLVSDSKPIFVYALDSQEIDLYKSIYGSRKLPKNVTITTDFREIATVNDYQIIMPHVWLQVMDKQHPLYFLLMDIKMKQMSFKRFASIMEMNFYENIQQHSFSLQYFQERLNQKKISCLIASGPSLDVTKKWLKVVNEKAFLMCVGSALKVLLKEGIVPDGVIISDCQPTIIEQLKDSGYTGDLFFLSTADFNTVRFHKGDKYILLQKGYELAEQYAKEMNYPLLETGGSVATTGFSLLQHLGFESIVLFGQDLGFMDEYTHATNSTSGRNFSKDEQYIEIESNAGAPIKTLPNLYSYLTWFNQNCKESTCNVYNTAKNGAKIESVPLLNEKQLYELIKNS
ncbi:motility associated factor glycosyltransferase family protein [Lysinibacillus sp. NPDC097195]|uniref:motility associated factor glycosyltransferase family protein n=1 Tax=Lysinibacillus sp. NPDC097195 TaxID=3364141 RepID=UPI00381589C5